MAVTQGTFLEWHQDIERPPGPSGRPGVRGLMVDYDVHPDGANAVIAATRTNAEEFERLITDLRTAVEDTAGACQSTLIAGALQEVHDGYLAKVATMAWWRSTNVVNEGRKMVDAFVAGDEAMGADAMAEMADVPSSWDDAQ